MVSQSDGTTPPDIPSKAKTTTPIGRIERTIAEITQAITGKIYEPILKDSGHVTTDSFRGGISEGQSAAAHGFKKETAEPDIAVVGDAAEDTEFHGRGKRDAVFLSTMEPGPST